MVCDNSKLAVKNERDCVPFRRLTSDICTESGEEEVRKAREEVISETVSGEAVSFLTTVPLLKPRPVATVCVFSLSFSRVLNVHNLSEE